MRRWTSAFWWLAQVGCVNDAMIAIRSDGGTPAAGDRGGWDQAADVRPAFEVGMNDGGLPPADLGVGVDAMDAAHSDVVVPDRPTVADVVERDASPRSDGSDQDVRGHDALELDASGVESPTQPRRVAPLAGSRVTQRRPTLHWVLPPGVPGARVEICADRACARVEHAWEVVGPAGRPPADLSPGVHFWRLAALTGGAGPAGPAWPFLVPSRSGDADTSWPALTDLNGDGRADLAVVTRGADAGDAFTIRAHLGRAGDLPAPGAGFTAASEPLVVAVGDLDGDGYGDLGVRRSCVEAGTDRIEIHRGGPDGPAPTPSAMILWREVSCVVGRAFVGVGDVNGDGYGDLLADSPVRAGGLGGFGSRVELYLGGAPGRLMTPSTALEGGTEYNAFGSPTALGDVNGDGFADVATVMQAGLIRGGGLIAGRILVHLGGAAGLGPAPSATLLNPSDDLGFRRLANAPLDDDGDGFADVFVTNGTSPDGAPWRIDLYRGSRAGVTSPPAATLAPTPLTGNLRGALSLSPVDFDDDGRSDLAVLATQRGSVSVQLFRGGDHAADAGSPTRFTLEDRSLAGQNTAHGGDFDGDGRVDLVAPLSSPGADAPVAEHRIEVLSGGAWPIGQTPRILLRGPTNEWMTLAR